MNRHTPGPWTAEINCTSVVSAGDVEIAVVEEGADALLIATAPDLLAVLKDELRLMSIFPKRNEKDRRERMAALIAKAEGGGK